MRQWSVWDLILCAGFMALVTGVALLHSPAAAAIVAGVLLMAAGILGARGSAPRGGPESVPPKE